MEAIRGSRTGRIDWQRLLLVRPKNRPNAVIGVVIAMQISERRAFITTLALTWVASSSGQHSPLNNTLVEVELE